MRAYQKKFVDPIQSNDAVQLKLDAEELIRLFQDSLHTEMVALVPTGGPVAPRSFYEFPRSMWRVHPLDEHPGGPPPRVPPAHQDPGLFGTEQAALTLLWALVAFGQIRLRRIDGHKDLERWIAKTWTQAA